MNTKKAYFNYIGPIQLPMDVVQTCSHPGDCMEDVVNCLLLPEIKDELSRINPESLKKELMEYGAWEEYELEDHEYNLQLILWIAACNISDEENDKYYELENKQSL